MKTFSKILTIGLLTATINGFAQDQMSRVQPHGCRPHSAITQVQISNLSHMITYDRLNNYMDLVNELRDFVTPLEYAQYIQPLKSGIINTQNTLDVYGPIHQETASSFLTLIDRADSASALFEELESREAFFEIVTDLKKTIMTIKRSTIN